MPAGFVRERFAGPAAGAISGRQAWSGVVANRRQDRRCAALAALALAAGAPAWGAGAQEAESAAPPSRICAGMTAVYAGPKGLRLVATRYGSVSPENPLRPLSGNRIEVLQVAVNGRVATAFGPDPENMRQGPDPKRLETTLGAPISWSAEAYPELIRIVAEDGRVLIDALRFQECAGAPASGVAPAGPITPGTGRGVASPRAPASGPTPDLLGTLTPRGALD